MALAAAWIAVMAGCVTGGSDGAIPQHGWVREELYLGATIPGGGEVSDEEWERFVEEEVAARFPDGFTVWEGQGRWRHADGTTVRERTRILVILRGADDEKAATAIGEVVRAYERRFGQEAVLRVSDPVDARF